MWIERMNDMATKKPAKQEKEPVSDVQAEKLKALREIGFDRIS